MPSSCCPNSPQRFPINKPPCPELLGEKKEPGAALPAGNQGGNPLGVGERTQQPRLCLGEDAPAGIAQIPGCEACWKVSAQVIWGEMSVLERWVWEKKITLWFGHHVPHGKWAERAILGEKCPFGIFLLVAAPSEHPQWGFPTPARGAGPKIWRRSWNRDPRAGGSWGWNPRCGHSGGHRTLGLGSWGILWGRGGSIRGVFRAQTPNFSL